MITLENLTEDNYFLPEDGEIARAKFLELVAIPTEGWISSYGFTMPEVFQVLSRNEDKGIGTHLLLDYTQSRGRTAVPLIKEHARHITKGGLTLTTAGINSKRTSQIWHFKAMVKEAPDGGEPWCWDGSVNMSASGWDQGNMARVFRSKQWADVFRKQHAEHTQWARQHMAEKQVSAMSVEDSIDAYFDSIDKENNTQQDIANSFANNIAKLVAEYYAATDRLDFTI